MAWDSTREAAEKLVSKIEHNGSETENPFTMFDNMKPEQRSDIMWQAAEINKQHRESQKTNRTLTVNECEVGMGGTTVESVSDGQYTRYYTVGRYDVKAKAQELEGKIEAVKSPSDQAMIDRFLSDYSNIAQFHLLPETKELNEKRRQQNANLPIFDFKTRDPLWMNDGTYYREQNEITEITVKLPSQLPKPKVHIEKE
ncbi:MAG TPA: hypothetical protein V6C81_06930 [Planktothrix sp.]|jgi:hypothetical protein